MALGSPLQPLAFPGAPGLLSPHRPVWDAKQEAEGKERGAAGRGAPGAAPRFEGAAAALPPALGRGGAAQALPAGGAPSLGCPPSAASLGTLCGPGSPKRPAFAPKRRQGEQSPLRQAARTQPLSSQLVSGQIAGLGPGLGSTKQK